MITSKTNMDRIPSETDDCPQPSGPEIHRVLWNQMVP